MSWGHRDDDAWKYQQLLTHLTHWRCTSAGSLIICFIVLGAWLEKDKEKKKKNACDKGVIILGCSRHTTLIERLLSVRWDISEMHQVEMNPKYVEFDNTGFRLERTLAWNWSIYWFYCQKLIQIHLMIIHLNKALLIEDLIHRPPENALEVDKSGFDSFLGKLTAT